MQKPRRRIVSTLDVSGALARVAFLLVALGAWESASRLRLLNPLAAPSPGAVWRGLLGLLRSGDYITDLLVTLREVGVAFAIATVAGLCVGYVIARSAFATRAYEPLLASLNAIPVVMLIPLFLLTFGLGIASKIVIGALSAFFPVALATIAGFSDVDRIYLRAARSMGASSQLVFRRVLLPAAAPVVLAGVRMGSVVAVLSTLGAETLGSYAGIGHRIVDSAETLSIPRMYAFIAFAVVLASLVNIALSALEKRVRWN